MTEVQRESRATVAQESPFNPMSLCGSWALMHTDGGSPQTALVVAEPQPGVYLLEFYNIADQSIGQRVVKLEEMANEYWSFYDTHRECVSAITELMNS